MPIRFACPVCKTTYTVNDRYGGKKAECKSCGQRIQVPAPTRNKTVLGEVLPPVEAGGPSPTTPPPAAARPAHEPQSPELRLPGAAASAGPIRFDCPGCRTSYSVNRWTAGKVMECRSCGRWMRVPGEAAPAEPARAAPEPPPEPPHEERWYSQVEADYSTPEEPPTPPELPSQLVRWRTPRRPNAPVNRIVASVGAGLVLIALFLPMVTGPFGIWLSFIDVPWKAVTVGFAIVDEVKAERRAEPDVPRNRAPREQPKKQDDPGRTAQGGLVMLVAIGSVLYPLLVLAALGLTGYQVAAARSASGYVLVGLVVGAATLLYAFGLLLLNTIPEMRLVMALVSPGFGWAVILVGAAAIAAAGIIRRENEVGRLS